MHILVVVLLVVSGAVFVDTSRLFTSDEGAVLAQARLLADSGWLLSHPAPEVDPTGQWFPYLNAEVTEDGRGAIYAKHPLYVVLLAPFVVLGGAWLAAALSMGAVVACALGGGALAEELGGRRRVGMWAAVLGSPLLFHGYLVMAHALAAALVAWGVWAALRARSTGPRHALVAVAAVAAAVMLRNEALLFALASAGALAVAGGRRRDLALSAGLLSGSLVAYAANRTWRRAIIPDAEVVQFPAASGASWINDRLSGLEASVLSPGHGDAWAVYLLLISTVLVVATALFARRSQDAGRGPLRALSVVAAGAGILSAVLEPALIVPGFLIAFPLALVVATFAPELWRLGPQTRIVLVAVAVFGGAVVATQYPVGGGIEWGGRYFALAIGPVAALGARVANEVRSRWDPRTWRMLLGAFTAVALALSARSLVTMRTNHERNHRALEAVFDTVEGIGPEDDGVVIATGGALVRFDWDSRRTHRWLLVDAAEVPTALDAAAEASEEVVLVTRDRRLLEEDALGGWTLQQAREADGWFVGRLVMADLPNVRSRGWQRG